MSELTTDTVDPFATPLADSGAARPDRRVHYGDATQGQRLGNYVVDRFAASGTAFLTAIPIAIVAPDAVDSLDFFIGYVGYVLYYVALEGLFGGRTLGKLITGTAAIRAEDGGKMTFGQVVGRSFARIVPFEPFSFLSSDARGWHDAWTKTRVVRLRPSQADLIAGPETDTDSVDEVSEPVHVDADLVELRRELERMPERL